MFEKLIEVIYSNVNGMIKMNISSKPNSSNRLGFNIDHEMKDCKKIKLQELL
jgi:hypothetical protein